MFGQNLRILARSYPSISELSRQLGINRTQFNRYIAGESFPRPDVLARICAFFDVDARVLLEPVETLNTNKSELSGPELEDYLGGGAIPNEALFPSGFYRFYRRSFMSPSKFVIGMVRVWRGENLTCFARGFEAREAMRQQGLPVLPELREFRGYALRLETGIGLTISRRNAMTASFNFLMPQPSFENNLWVGYVARTVPENPDAPRVTRMVYEHVGTRIRDGLKAGRGTGIVDEANVPEFYNRLLRGQAEFK